MSEPTTTPTEPVEAAATAEPELGDGGKKALDAERRARATAEREAKAYKAKLDELEQASLSELDKAKKAAADAIAQLEAERANALRQRVALEKGLPANLVDRLRGETEADIAADADALMALVTAPRTPAPDPFQGPQGSADGHLTPEQEFAAFTQSL